MQKLWSVSGIAILLSDIGLFLTSLCFHYPYHSILSPIILFCRTSVLEAEWQNEHSMLLKANVRSDGLDSELRARRPVVSYVVDCYISDRSGVELLALIIGSGRWTLS